MFMLAKNIVISNYEEAKENGIEIGSFLEWFLSFLTKERKFFPINESYIQESEEGKAVFQKHKLILDNSGLKNFELEEEKKKKYINDYKIFAKEIEALFKKYNLKNIDSLLKIKKAADEIKEKSNIRSFLFRDFSDVEFKEAEGYADYYRRSFPYENISGVTSENDYYFQLCKYGAEFNNPIFAIKPNWESGYNVRTNPVGFSINQNQKGQQFWSTHLGVIRFQTPGYDAGVNESASTGIMRIAMKAQILNAKKNYKGNFLQAFTLGVSTPRGGHAISVVPEFTKQGKITKLFWNNSNQLSGIYEFDEYLLAPLLGLARDNILNEDMKSLVFQYINARNDKNGNRMRKIYNTLSEKYITNLHIKPQVNTGECLTAAKLISDGFVKYLSKNSYPKRIRKLKYKETGETFHTLNKKSSDLFKKELWQYYKESKNKGEITDLEMEDFTNIKKITFRNVNKANNEFTKNLFKNRSLKAPNLDYLNNNDTEYNTNRSSEVQNIQKDILM